jgi:CRISPR-associated endoribonuclease Cas6
VSAARAVPWILVLPAKPDAPAAGAAAAPEPPPAGAPYALPRIPYVRLRCTLAAVEQAMLPPFKGSLLRGAFGHALRRTVCAVGPEQECASCRLRRTCVHTRLFETFVEAPPPPFLAGVGTSPRPYVFEPAGERRSFAPGEPLEFDLLLFGQAIDLEAYALLAVERMAAAGLGSGRCRFALERVRAPGPDGVWQTLFADGRAPARGPLAPALPRQDPLGERAVLRFSTPTRLKVRDHLTLAVRFRDLAFAMLRRTLELAHFHVPGAAIDWDFHRLLARAGDVRVAAADLTWHDWERYSNRQQTKMAMGGFVGRLELAGDLAPFAPLLRAAEVVHVGKGATFGLGRMEVAADA